MLRIFLLLLAVLCLPFASHAEFPAKEIYMKYSPSVVVIRASKDSGGGMIGTGSIITNGGLVITNAHVVINKEENKPYKKVGVFIKPAKMFADNKDLQTYYDAEVVRYDVPLDLAVLKIKSYDLKVEAIEFADPKDISIGEEVIAIGHPEQGGFWTLTYGRISADHKDYQGVSGKDMYQTDTSVNRGNSGGPLLDRRGYMVAVNSNIARLSKDGLPITGINYSIKSSVVIKWLNENGFKIAYGIKPVEEVVVAKTDVPRVNELKPLKENGQAVVVKEKKREAPEGKESKLQVVANVKKEEKKFETPERPYSWDDFIKEAEKELEDMMDDMRGKIRR